MNSKEDVELTALVFHLIERSHYFQDAALVHSRTRIHNNNSLFVRRKIAYKYDLILEAARNSKRTSKTVIAATTTVETSWVENLKSEKPSKMLLGKARQ